MNMMNNHCYTGEKSFENKQQRLYFPNSVTGHFPQGLYINGFESYLDDGFISHERIIKRYMRIVMTDMCIFGVL